MLVNFRIDLTFPGALEVFGRAAKFGKTLAELPAKLEKKYAGLLDRVSYYFPLVPGENEAGWRASAVGFKR